MHPGIASGAVGSQRQLEMSLRSIVKRRAGEGVRGRDPAYLRLCINCSHELLVHPRSASDVRGRVHAVVCKLMVGLALLVLPCTRDVGKRHGPEPVQLRDRTGGWARSTDLGIVPAEPVLLVPLDRVGGRADGGRDGIRPTGTHGGVLTNRKG